MANGCRLLCHVGNFPGTCEYIDRRPIVAGRSGGRSDTLPPRPRPPQRRHSDDSPTQVSSPSPARSCSAPRSAACGSSSDSSSNEHRQDPRRPGRRQHDLSRTSRRQWFADVSTKFKKQTGATVKFETFASRQRRADQDPDLGAVRAGPGHLRPRHHVHPDRVLDRRVRRCSPTTTGRRSAAGPVPAGDARHLRSGRAARGRHPVRQPAVRDGLQQGPARRRPASTSRRPRWDGLLDQAKKLTKGDIYGLAIAYADGFDPWKFIWAMSIQAGNPLVDGRQGATRRPDREDRVPDLLRLARQGQGGRPGRDRLEERAGDRGVRCRQGGVPADGVGHARKVTLDKSAVAGKYAYALMPTIPPGATATAGRRHGRPPASSPATTWSSRSTPRTRTWPSPLVKHADQPPTARTSTTRRSASCRPTPRRRPKLQSDPALARDRRVGRQVRRHAVQRAWGQVQLALVNVVVQSIPNLSKGAVDDAALTALIAKAQSDAQAALDKAK